MNIHLTHNKELRYSVYLKQDWPRVTPGYGCDKHRLENIKKPISYIYILLPHESTTLSTWSWSLSHRGMMHTIHCSYEASVVVIRRTAVKSIRCLWHSKMKPSLYARITRCVLASHELSDLFYCQCCHSFKLDVTCWGMLAITAYFSSNNRWECMHARVPSSVIRISREKKNLCFRIIRISQLSVYLILTYQQRLLFILTQRRWKHFCDVLNF